MVFQTKQHQKRMEKKKEKYCHLWWTQSNQRCFWTQYKCLVQFNPVQFSSVTATCFFKQKNDKIERIKVQKILAPVVDAEQPEVVLDISRVFSFVQLHPHAFSNKTKSKKKGKQKKNTSTLRILDLHSTSVLFNPVQFSCIHMFFYTKM